MQILANQPGITYPITECITLYILKDTNSQISTTPDLKKETLMPLAAQHTIGQSKSSQILQSLAA